MNYFCNKATKIAIWVCSSIVTLIGLTVLYGWFINSSKIVQIHPTLTPMQFNTALCFTLSGLSLMLMLQKNPTFKKISQYVNYAVGIFSFLTLSQYVFNINLGLDELFFNHSITTNTFHKGRMAPDTAIAFFIFSHALSIQVKYQEQKSLHLAFGGIVLFLGTLNLLGYIFDFGTLIRISHLTQMALNTSFCFTLLGIGIILYYLSIKALDNEETKNIYTWSRYTLSITFILIFLDVRFSVGFISGIQYLLLIFYGWYIKNKKTQIILTTISTACVLLGHYLNNQTEFFNEGIINRFFTIFIIWIVSYILLDLIKKNKTINDKVNELESKKNTLQQYNFISSHDLQEPISTILGFSNVLIEKHQNELDENSIKSLELIKKSAIKMQKLIKELLNHSLIGNEVKFEKINCNEILNELNDSYALKLKEKNGTIIYENLPIIRASKIEIVLLFQNLISNAIKFSSKNKPLKIDIKCKKNKENWYFTVRDNGIGIKEKEFKNIFYIFKRLNKKTAYKGFGIGLANCKKYVELHKGEIWVTSKINEGTTFHFTIKRRA